MSGPPYSVRRAPRPAPRRRPRGECFHGRRTRRPSRGRSPRRPVSAPGPYDGPVQCRAAPNGFVGNPFARRYAWKTSSSAVAWGSAAIDEIITYRSIPAASAASAKKYCRIAVDGLLAGYATAGPRARGEHDGVGALELGRDVVDRGLLQIDHQRVAPRAARSPTCAGFLMNPATESPRDDSSRSRINAILPCPPAMTMCMPSFYSLSDRSAGGGSGCLLSCMNA